MAKKKVSTDRGRALNSEAAFGKAWRKLSFYNRRTRSSWSPRIPSAAYIEAQRICGDRGKLDRGTAEYGVGCGVGRAAADEYIEFVREHGGFYGYSFGCSLQTIMMDMLLGKSSDDHMARGQAVGFCSALGQLLVGAVRHARSPTVGSRP